MNKQTHLSIIYANTPKKESKHTFVYKLDFPRAIQWMSIMKSEINTFIKKNIR